ncbi:helix-turn-helix domain-containing protein [Streptomyces xiamenensis]
MTTGQVSGYVLKICREQTGQTQQRFAERCGVDITTMQSWESGRRPLAAMSAGSLAAIIRRLVAMGADPTTVALLDTAMQADSIISHALTAGGDDVRTHPLSQWVITRNVTHMIAWALNGQTPAALPQWPARRSGPVPNAPLLAPDAQRAFFASVRSAAERAGAAGDAGALLARQCLYLSSYDMAGDTRAWIGSMSTYPLVKDHTEWSPSWVTARSVATSVTRHGQMDLLDRFIRDGLASDTGSAANLAYWAHWLGVDRLPRSGDEFMADSATTWDPSALLRALMDRLSPGLGCLALNVRSVWSLTLAHPWLLSDPTLGKAVGDRAELLLDCAELPATTRKELDQMHYGVRLYRR